jgi:hypothetical protein
MEALFNTALVGLGILLGAYVITVLLIRRWLKLSSEAVQVALYEDELPQRDLRKILARLDRTARWVGRMKLLTMEIPVLAPALLVLLIISWVCK